VVATRSRLRFSRDVRARLLHVEPERVEIFCQGDEVIILRFQDGNVVFTRSRERVVSILSDDVMEYSMPEAEFEAAT
jgi:hypothetical protein